MLWMLYKKSFAGSVDEKIFCKGGICTTFMIPVLVIRRPSSVDRFRRLRQLHKQSLRGLENIFENWEKLRKCFVSMRSWVTVIQCPDSNNHERSMFQILVQKREQSTFRKWSKWRKFAWCVWLVMHDTDKNTLCTINMAAFRDSIMMTWRTFKYENQWYKNPVGRQ